MRLRISMESWTAKLLLTLAAVPVAACSQVVGSGAGGSGGSAASVSSSTGSAAALCKDPVILEVGGKDTGYETCADGRMHRRENFSCPAPTPAGTGTGTSGSGGPVAELCVTDADCMGNGGNRMCRCSQTGNYCVFTGCHSDADCNGTLCAEYDAVGGNGCAAGDAYACTSKQDECVNQQDCAAGAVCTLDYQTTSERACLTPICCNTPTCGRPFLVDGAPRSAPAEARSDWSANGLSPRLAGLDAAQRAALCAHWTAAGLMEHASIAAFARFVLQLLSVGAPPELVIEAQAAIADESAHARACFALASAYGGSEVGPGRLALSGALDEADERSILVMVLREGCIGETIAALEAAEAREHAVDPVVRGALAKIAEDEGRHAALAWRYAAWAIARGGESLREVAREVLVSELGDAGPAPEVRDEPMLPHGVMSDAHRAEIRRQAMAGAITPSALVLLGIALPRPAAAAPRSSSMAA